jgi:toxin ParE1/3/4
MHYRLTPDAQADLREIRLYTLDRWGAERSRAYLEGLTQTLDTLCTMPKMGRPQEEIRQGLRSHLHRSHCIYYLLIFDTLYVLGVLHQSRVPQNHLKGRELNADRSL